MFDEKKDNPGSESLHVQLSSVELGRNRDHPRPLRVKKQGVPFFSRMKRRGLLTQDTDSING